MKPEATRRLLESLEGTGQFFNSTTIPTVVQQQPQSMIQAMFDLFKGGGFNMISGVPSALFQITPSQQEKLDQAATNSGLQNSIKNMLSGGPTTSTITNIFTSIFNSI